MSMTIERIAFAVLMVVVFWIGLMALVMRLSDVAPAAVVPLPSASLLSNLPEEAAILGLNGGAITLVNRPGLARDLYKAGAFLVLPAGLTGCLPLTRAQRRALVAGG